ncbi:hypothetical protein BH11PLA2_BH11PLA2_15640 [soil metagenome]
MAEPTPTAPAAAKYEFNDEQNRTFSSLASAMSVAAGLLQMLGLVLAILAILQGMTTTKGDFASFGPIVGLTAAGVLLLAFGFWTSGAARSFRKVAETKNEDLWHLMNALRTLNNMYSLVKTIILGSLVLGAVGLVLLVLKVTGKG